MLKQIDLPHSYYFREMYLPQLTSGPSGVDFSPDGQELVYSMAGSLWRQKIGDGVAVELTYGPGYDYQPEWSPDGRHIVFVRHHRNAIELQRLNVQTLAVETLTSGGAVNVEPRYSPAASSSRMSRPQAAVTSICSLRRSVSADSERCGPS